MAVPDPPNERLRSGDNSTRGGRFWHYIGCLALAMSPSGVGLASDGVLEINSACVVQGCGPGDAPGLPVTISRSGSYALTGDLTSNTYQGTFIQIDASHVWIDFRGFRVGYCVDGGTCTPSGGLAAAVAASDATSNLTLRDGAVINAGGAGIAITSFSRIARMTVTSSGGVGIVASGTGNIIEHCIVENAGSYGVEASADGANMLRESTIRNSKLAGIFASAGLTFAQNTLSDNNAGGEQITGAAALESGGGLETRCGLSFCPFYSWKRSYDEDAPYNRDETRCVSDVVEKFKGIIRHPEPLAINASTATVPVPTGSEHWQGMTRQPDYNQELNAEYEYFYMTKNGGGPTCGAACEGGLYQFKVKPQWVYDSSFAHQATRTNIWAKNALPSETAPLATSHFFDSSDVYHIRAQTDKNKYCKGTDPADCDFCDHWSGFGQTRSMAAIPMHDCVNNSGESMDDVLALFDVRSVPHQPLHLKTHATGEGSIPAAGIIPDGHSNGKSRYLVVSVGNGFNSVRLWHFDEDGELLGRTNDWDTQSMLTFGHNGGARGVNNISLVRECDTHDVYAVGTSRSLISDPQAVGTDNLLAVWKVHEPEFDLYGNIVDGSTWNGLDENVDQGATLLRQYWCDSQNTGGSFCDFGKSANVYVSEAGYPILYASESDSAHTYLALGYDFGVRVAEFPYRELTRDEAWISLYYLPNFDETAFNAMYTFTASSYFRDVENYEELWLINPTAGDINNKASSAIVYLPPGCWITIYQNGGSPPGGNSMTFSADGIAKHLTLSVDDQVSAVVFGPNAQTCASQGP